MAWREQRNHSDDCYFCMTKITSYSKRTAKNIVYPSLPSAMRPAPFDRGEEIPVPKDSSSSNSISTIDNSDKSIELETDFSPRTISQEQLDALVRKLYLSKDAAYTAGSMLKQFGVLSKDTRVTCYKERKKEFYEFFSTQEESKVAFFGLLVAIYRRKYLEFKRRVASYQE